MAPSVTPMNISCCCCLVTQPHPTLCDPMDCSMPELPVLYRQTEFAQLIPVELMVSSNRYLILCHLLLLLPSVFPGIIFPNESAVYIRWPKYWSFSISPSNEYSGLISFRIDWIYLLIVQRTLKSLLQHRNSQVNILLLSAFFMVQLSHLYMTTGKTIALTIQTCVIKVMSLLFNMLSRFVTAFLPKLGWVKIGLKF